MIETVSKGKVISLEYTVKLEDNQVVDTNMGKDPLTYTQGGQSDSPWRRVSGRGDDGWAS